MEIFDFMSTNVYTFSGSLLIAGSCLQTVSPAGFAACARGMDQIAALCLEQTHLNMALTKLTAILGAGQVTSIRFATVDRSPHCTQMHFMVHEIERVLPEHIPMESFVVADGVPCPVSWDAIALSKSLAKLTELTQRKSPEGK